MNKLHPPISWVGGKSRLRDTIISKIPDHHTYVEVFAGAAWVLFGKEPSKVEVINDINGDLVNLFLTVKNKPEEFSEALWYMFPSRQLHKISLYILENPDRDKILTDVERAVLFYYQIKHSFGSKYASGWRFSSSRPPRNVIDLETLHGLRERLCNVYVDNLPFERVIKNYDGKDTFFYCDPPYVVADGSNYYQFVFDEKKHVALRDKLAKAKGKWLVSYDDVDLVRDLYRGFRIEVTKPVHYSMGSKNKTTLKHELLISNY